MTATQLSNLLGEVIEEANSLNVQLILHHAGNPYGNKVQICR